MERAKTDPTFVAPQEIRAILDALKGIRFGSVEIVLQDSRIVQIERSEKRRLV